MKNPGESAIDLIRKEFSEDIANNRDFDIDGIVFKKNEIDMHDIQTEYRPKTMIALKPKFILKETVLRNIEWCVKNGTVTPVAHFSKIELQGATISKASLCNVKMLETMGLEIGHKILVCRCGMIIPKIIKDVTTGKYAPEYEQ